MKARAVAFYLPQFFPIPENDQWWGPGFTEWTNTAKARPLFRGHVQPTLPADLGFYDLRVAETRQAQSDLARDYGVEAFVYWHYWFGEGDRILERPFREVLESGAPEVSFCLAWANQSWTGIWHDAGDKVLKHQRYPGPEDDQRHFDAILPAFRDERYLRVDGKPVFYVFRPEELPDARGVRRPVAGDGARGWSRGLVPRRRSRVTCSAAVRATSPPRVTGSMHPCTCDFLSR